MEIELEIAKAQAVLNNLIQCVKQNSEVDVLGSLYVLADQLQRVDEAADKLY